MEGINKVLLIYYLGWFTITITGCISRDNMIPKITIREIMTLPLSELETKLSILTSDEYYLNTKKPNQLSAYPVIIYGRYSYIHISDSVHRNIKIRYPIIVDMNDIFEDSDYNFMPSLNYYYELIDSLTILLGNPDTTEIMDALAQQDTHGLLRVSHCYWSRDSLRHEIWLYESDHSSMLTITLYGKTVK